MKRALVAIATFGGALLAGWQMSPGLDSIAEARPITPDAIVVTAAEHVVPVARLAESSICTGGMEGPLGVEIVPVRSVASAIGEVLRYGVQLRNRSAASLRARYSIELVTDVGSPVFSPETSARIDLGATATTSDERDTPTGLADGFYILRVTAVATGTAGDAAEIVHLFFEIAEGRLFQLDTDEFYGRSNANAGVVR